MSPMFFRCTTSSRRVVYSPWWRDSVTSAVLLGLVSFLLTFHFSAGSKFTIEPVTTQSSPTGTRYGARLGFVNGTLIVLGGKSIASFDSTALNDVWTSNDGGVNWNKKSDFPGTARWAYSFINPPGPDATTTICVLGGETTRSGSRNLLSDVWCSDNNGYSWSRTSWSLPIRLAYFAATAVDSPSFGNAKIFIAGGLKTGAYYTETVYALDWSTKVWTIVSSDWGQGSQCCGTLWPLADTGRLIYGGGELAGSWSADNYLRASLSPVGGIAVGSQWSTAYGPTSGIRSPLLVDAINSTNWILLMAYNRFLQLLSTEDGGKTLQIRVSSTCAIDDTDSSSRMADVVSTAPNGRRGTQITYSDPATGVITATVPYYVVKSWVPTSIWRILEAVDPSPTSSATASAIASWSAVSTYTISALASLSATASSTFTSSATASLSATVSITITSTASSSASVSSTFTSSATASPSATVSTTTSGSTTASSSASASTTITSSATAVPTFASLSTTSTFTSSTTASSSASVSTSSTSSATAILSATVSTTGTSSATVSPSATGSSSRVSVTFPSSTSIIATKIPQGGNTSSTAVLPTESTSPPWKVTLFLRLLGSDARSLAESIGFICALRTVISHITGVPLSEITVVTVSKPFSGPQFMVRVAQLADSCVTRALSQTESIQRRLQVSLVELEVEIVLDASRTTLSSLSSNVEVTVQAALQTMFSNSSAVDEAFVDVVRMACSAQGITQSCPNPPSLALRLVPPITPVVFSSPDVPVLVWGLTAAGLLGCLSILTCGCLYQNKQKKKKETIAPLTTTIPSVSSTTLITNFNYDNPTYIHRQDAPKTSFEPRMFSRAQ